MTDLQKMLAAIGTLNMEANKVSDKAKLAAAACAPLALEWAQAMICDRADTQELESKVYGMASTLSLTGAFTYNVLLTESAKICGFVRESTKVDLPDDLGCNDR